MLSNAQKQRRKRKWMAVHTRKFPVVFIRGTSRQLINSAKRWSVCRIEKRWHVGTSKFVTVRFVNSAEENIATKLQLGMFQRHLFAEQFYCHFKISHLQLFFSSEITYNSSTTFRPLNFGGPNKLWCMSLSRWYFNSTGEKALLTTRYSYESYVIWTFAVIMKQCCKYKIITMLKALGSWREKPLKKASVKIFWGIVNRRINIRVENQDSTWITCHNTMKIPYSNLILSFEILVALGLSSKKFSWNHYQTNFKRVLTKENFTMPFVKCILCNLPEAPVIFLFSWTWAALKGEKEGWGGGGHLL